MNQLFKMKKEYKDKISEIFPLPLDDEGLEKISKFIIIKEVPAGTLLLHEGDKAANLFMVIKGCLRSYFIKENGVEITSQFFIERQMVASIESAMIGTPSRSNIDAIEDSIIGIIQMKNLLEMIQKDSIAKDHFIRILFLKLINYMNLHASFILDNPEKRYKKLLKDNPELVSRLPQQYIASYLGITPVSLSRIRARLKKQISNC
jgi:CRP-like cAMP-binding protein